MADNAPTLDQMRSIYIDATEGHRGDTPDETERGDEFDQFVAAIKAEALREAAAWKQDHNLGHGVWGTYLEELAREKYHAGGDDMVTVWLQDRAHRIETNTL